MGHENEDDEIEQYLVEKVSHAIGGLDDRQNLVTKLYSFKNEFTNLLNELKRKTKPNVKADNWCIVRRNYLYSLNNLVSECKNQRSLSAKEVYESCEKIKKSLKKMMKEIDGKESSSSRGDRDRSPHHQEPHHPIYKRNKDEVHRWSSRHPPTKFRGSDHRVLALERDLVMRNLDAPFKAFGIVGAAGIGKTTLCQTIFGRDLVKQRFCPRIWVCLSKQPADYKKDYRKQIVIRILKNLGIEDEVIENAGNDEKQGLRRLILLLRLQLTGKRYLIVLDDAWNEDNNNVVKFFSNLNQKAEELDGEELAYGLPKGCGGTVISSSTSKALLKQMLGEDAGLQFMTSRRDETIYEIFKDTVIGYDEDEREFPPYLEELKDELLKKCDGNPLAAKLLAKIARQNLMMKPKLQSRNV